MYSWYLSTSLDLPTLKVFILRGRLWYVKKLRILYVCFYMLETSIKLFPFLILCYNRILYHISHLQWLLVFEIPILQ